MTVPPRTRRVGPTLVVALDLVRHARATRTWLPLLLVVLAVVAAVVVFLGHTVVPWAIYPAL